MLLILIWALLCNVIGSVDNTISKFVDAFQLVAPSEFIEIKDKRDYNQAFSPPRSDYFTRKDVFESVQLSKKHHKFCALIPDVWACTGDKYVTVLDKVDMFDEDKFGLNLMHKDTFMLVMGSLNIAQMLLYWVCSSDAARVWSITPIHKPNITANDFMVRLEETNVSILLLDEESHTELTSEWMVSWLNNTGLSPDVLVFPEFHPRDYLHTTHRHSVYKDQFPDARVVEFTRYGRDRKSCTANYQNCEPATKPPTSAFLPQCIPGPIVREGARSGVELFAKEVLLAAKRVPIAAVTTNETDAAILAAYDNMDSVASVLRKYFSYAVFVNERRLYENSLHSFRTKPVPAPPRHFSTWKEVSASITAGGHRYCNIIRDGWACVGEAYTERLKATPVFDNNTFAVDRLPNNSVLVLEGNSQLAELVFYWACESDNADIWKITATTATNSLYVRVHRPGYTASLLLLDNDEFYNMYPESVATLLIHLGITPQVIVIGPFNPFTGADRGVTVSEFKHAFPDAHFLTLPSNLFTNKELWCGADFTNCVPGQHSSRGEHECVPGPVARHAETLVQQVLNTFERDVDIPQF